LVVKEVSSRGRHVGLEAPKLSGAFDDAWGLRRDTEMSLEMPIVLEASPQVSSEIGFVVRALTG
jgi:hypothetical protein